MTNQLIEREYNYTFIHVRMHNEEKTIVAAKLYDNAANKYVTNYQPFVCVLILCHSQFEVDNFMN